MTPAIQHESLFSPIQAPHDQLRNLLASAGVWPIADTGWLRVTGADRVRWLNGMVTNNIQTMKPGEGCYNFILNAQGRIQGDACAFAQDDALLLETDRSRLPALMTLLDRFIIMDDVELADISGLRSGLALAGPHAASMLEAIGIPAAPAPTPAADISLRTALWRGASIDIIHACSPFLPRFELWTGQPTAEALLAALTGATRCDPSTVEWLSLLEGTPRYGTDIRDRELPQETGQTRALHFAKGCYLGQEIVERIRSRGAVHRIFTGFLLRGDLPPAGTALLADGKPAGELTRSSEIPLPGNTVTLALGYARREALDRHAELHYPGGIALPIALPYRPT